LGKGWLGALLFSIVVSMIFGLVFSYTAEMGIWIGLATFLATFLIFLGFIVLINRGRETQRVNELTELRRAQAYELKEEEDDL